jgi:hypothetical protein
MSQPMTAKNWFKRGLDLNNNSDAEIHCYTEAIALNPRYALAYYARGLARKQRGRAEAAASDLPMPMRSGCAVMPASTAAILAVRLPITMTRCA